MLVFITLLHIYVTHRDYVSEQEKGFPMPQDTSIFNVVREIRDNSRKLWVCQKVKHIKMDSVLT